MYTQGIHSVLVTQTQPNTHLVGDCGQQHTVWGVQVSNYFRVPSLQTQQQQKMQVRVSAAQEQVHVRVRFKLSCSDSRCL